MADATSYLAPHVMDYLRRTIHDADGNEVFFIGRTNADMVVIAVEEHARGHDHAVNAFFERAGSGEVLIHNHPGGALLPSNADLEIAGRAGALGAGFFIIDNTAEHLYPVVLPWKQAGFTPIDTDYAEALLGADGVLARNLPGFEGREGQRDMAQSVAQVLSQGGVSIIEAGTGIGKSYAYLLPALKLARDNDTCVIVSTASLALQGQLVEKDIPALAAALGDPIRVEVLKGRSNYVSLRRAKEALTGSRSLFPDLGQDALDSFSNWLEHTPDGDRAGAGDMFDAELWEAAQSESDNCLRARCPTFQQCHYFNSRRRAAAAHLVIVNHALLAADLAVRHEAGLGFGETVLLPPYRHLVLDEAHAFEHYARNQFGARTSELAIVRTIGQLARQRKRGGALRRLRDKLADRHTDFTRGELQEMLGRLDGAVATLNAVRHQTTLWFSQLSDWHDEEESGGTVRTPVATDAFEQVVESGSTMAGELDEAARRVLSIAGLDEDELPPDIFAAWQEVASRARRLERHAAAIRAVLTNRSRDEVSWIERVGRQRRLAMHIAPVDVGKLLGKALWQRQRAAVLTSATLATGPEDFTLLKRGLGLVDMASEDRQIASPFDYPALVCMHVVTGLPAGGGAGFRDWIDLVAQLIALSHGRSLVLCTSYGAVRALGRGLRSDPRCRGYRILVQGESHPARLAEQFRADIGSVLVGTTAFWEGFDAAGDTLRHVIMTKLPFSVPSHPLEQARHDWVAAQGQDPFMDLSLPEAVTRFRQGFGRLVRTQVDWGAVTVLDERMVRKGYGKRFLRSLPPGMQVHQRDSTETVTALTQWFAAQQKAVPSASG